MIRRVIQIDENLCDGCGICATACHEGAIAIVEGKARLVRDDFCDGLGDCLPACPTGAITFVEREALAYDQAAVDAFRESAGGSEGFGAAAASGCPGARARSIRPSSERPAPESPWTAVPDSDPAEEAAPSQLTNWPVQIKLVPTSAPYFDGAHLLVAADCCAFAYGSFHRDFMAGRTCVIGCPKLDSTDYSDKLSSIFGLNDIASVTVARMQVPCCGGIEQMTRRALDACGKNIPSEVVTFSLDGKILD